MGFSGQLQCGEGSLFILCRYEWKLPWFVKNWVMRKFGLRGRESLWYIEGINIFVWEAFAEFWYIAFHIFV